MNRERRNRRRQNSWQQTKHGRLYSDLPMLNGECLTVLDCVQKTPSFLRPRHSSAGTALPAQVPILE